MNETNYTPLKYRGNGVTTSFSFSWKVMQVDELIVGLEEIATGEITTLVRGSDYSATINAVGGNVTVNSAPSSEYNLVLSRKTSNYQKTGYSTSTGFQGTELEKSFDRYSCALQDMEYNIEKFKQDFSTEVDDTITEFEGEVNGAIDNIDDKVDDANTGANSAITKAEQAISTANEANTKASNALSTANTASTNASNALSSATSASTNASNALSSANTASQLANSASATATEAKNKVNVLEGEMQTVISAAEKINQLDQAILTCTNSAQTASDKADIATQKAQEATNAVASIKQPDWNEADATSKAYIKNKPTNVSDFTNDSGFITTSDLTSYQLIAQDMSSLSASGTISLSDNTVNKISATGSITFTLPAITDLTKLHQIFIQFEMASAQSIDTGTTYYFNNTAPDLSNAGTYNLYYEYDNTQSHWVVGCLPKGASV